MKKYGFLVSGIFIVSFISLSQAMYKRKVSDAFGAEESGSSVKILRKEKNDR
ncbi:hypothetical protein [Endozoicomonas sp. Mp262]|uniref:hypothetical protein n=1 Tax=Endozoicomonas sp. Mp262 TaxID=2919499 RepID=UPI0021D86EF2